MNGALARRVVDCLHTVGPAEIYACGAEPLPKAPTNVSDGHGRVPLSGSQCSAQESPAFRHGEWSSGRPQQHEPHLSALRVLLQGQPEIASRVRLHEPEHPVHLYGTCRSRWGDQREGTRRSSVGCSQPAYGVTPHGVDASPRL